jgi:cytochrome c556
MNDDFLYRIRTEPPPHFAQALKARLDRLPRRGARLASFGFGLFLFGTAFALVSPAAREMIAGWFGAKPEVDETALVAAPSAEGTVPAASPAPPANPSAASPPASARSTPPDEGEFPPDRMTTLTSDEVAFLVEMENARAPREQRAARAMELLAEVEQQLGAVPQTAEAMTSAPDSADEQSEFIVTGPLLAEAGTAAYAFQNRRALFEVMEWTAEPVFLLLKRRAPFDDARKFEVIGRRLEQLAHMIPDAFAQDTRKSDVQTRALDRVWEDRALFARRVEEMELAARLLTIAAMKGDELGVRQAATRIGNTCATCHYEFRKKAENNVGDKYP